MYPSDFVSQSHIDVLQLGFGRGLVQKLQDSAQITNVDASLVQSLCERGSIHWQSAMVQTVFHLHQPQKHRHTENHDTHTHTYEVGLRREGD